MMCFRRNIPDLISLIFGIQEMPSGTQVKYPLDIWPKECDIKDYYSIEEIIEEQAKNLPKLD